MNAIEKAMWAFLNKMEDTVRKVQIRSVIFKYQHQIDPHTFIVTDQLWKLQEAKDKTLRQLIADGDVALVELTPDQFSILVGEEA